MIYSVRSAHIKALSVAVGFLAAIALAFIAITPAAAQAVESFDPDEMFESASTVANPVADSAVDEATGLANREASRMIDADLVDPNAAQQPTASPAYEVSPPQYTTPATAPVPVPDATRPGFDEQFDAYSAYGTGSPASDTAAATDIAAGEASPAIPAASTADTGTYGEDDLIGAAEGVFGKGAEGLAKMIQDLLKDQGQPNGYIVGREAGGAFIFGARYGSGTLHHKIEGQRKVYWTGPSVGFDAGANAANTFVLVYNLYDTQDLFKRYAAGEGQAYFIGGLHASYVRRGDVVLIPIRMGVGARLGINAGYLKFSEKQRWLPF